MSFGENVGYYRKRLGLTQEELAEKLFISRQTVSRWETDSTFPDVEMLIRLCDLFMCDMDTLVRGSAQESSVFRDGSETKEDVETEISKDASCKTKELSGEKLAAYDKHMNKFAFLIALGVFGIIFGVSVMLLCQAFSLSAELSVCIMLGFIAVSVAVFIISGLGHTDFMKENPIIGAYPKDLARSFSRKMAVMIVTATVLLFGGIIAIIIMCNDSAKIPSVLTLETWEYLSAAILLFCIAVSVFLYVLAGMIHSKYETDEYNNECIKQGFAEGEYRKKKEGKPGDSICGVIMIIATAVFLLLGFTMNLWHPAWVAFPIGGLLCGAVSIISEAVSKK